MVMWLPAWLNVPVCLKTASKSQMCVQAHDDRNMARQLTPSERKAKKEKKLLGAAQEGEAALVSVFCIRDLSSPQNKFKVRVNAEVRPGHYRCLSWTSFAPRSTTFATETISYCSCCSITGCRLWLMLQCDAPLVFLR